MERRIFLDYYPFSVIFCWFFFILVMFVMLENAYFFVIQVLLLQIVRLLLAYVFSHSANVDDS